MTPQFLEGFLACSWLHLLLGVRLPDAVRNIQSIWPWIPDQVCQIFVAGMLVAVPVYFMAKGAACAVLAIARCSTPGR